MAVCSMTIRQLTVTTLRKANSGPKTIANGPVKPIKLAITHEAYGTAIAAMNQLTFLPVLKLGLGLELGLR